MTWSLQNISEWSYGGVDHSIQGNGGPGCTGFLSLQRRLYETLLACTIALITFYWGYQHIKLPKVPTTPTIQRRRGKKAFLIVMCLIFGTEIGFKLSSRTVIYFLNPCHVITIIQIYLLASDSQSRRITILFRIQMHCLHGAFLALLFPVLNTRLLPLETANYWLQHTLMLFIPFYLLRLGGVYSVEGLRDWSWCLLTKGLFFSYHFVLLQFLGLVTEVNLNSMICPAVSDPFYGDNYRLWAIAHQAILSLTIGKLYTFFSLFILQWVGPPVVWMEESSAKSVGGVLTGQLVCSQCKDGTQNGGTSRKGESHKE